MLEQVEASASRLRNQVMNATDELVHLLEQRAIFRAENSDYLGLRTPQALVDVEFDVSMSVPMEDNGKSIPQGRRDELVKRACRKSETWSVVNDQCKAARRAVAKMDGEIEARQARVSGSHAVLTYYASMFNYLAAMESAVRF